MEKGSNASGLSYIVICQQIVGGGPYEIEYSSDRIEWKYRDNAIRHGFKIRRSDDFNIGVLQAGKLTSFDWMETPIDHDLQTISQALSMEVA